MQVTDTEIDIRGYDPERGRHFGSVVLHYDGTQDDAHHLAQFECSAELGPSAERESVAGALLREAVRQFRWMPEVLTGELRLDFADIRAHRIAA